MAHFYLGIMGAHMKKLVLFLAVIGLLVIPSITFAADTEVTIKATDDLKYDTSEIKAKAGSKVKITITNIGTNATMAHNVVVLKPAADINAFGMAAMLAGEAKHYMPESADIIAHTELAKPGESKSIEFTAPAAGDYPYICSFPGHYTIMKGVLKVS
jgi:azurin